MLSPISFESGTSTPIISVRLEQIVGKETTNHKDAVSNLVHGGNSASPHLYPSTLLPHPQYLEGGWTLTYIAIAATSCKHWEHPATAMNRDNNWLAVTTRYYRSNPSLRQSLPLSSSINLSKYSLFVCRCKDTIVGAQSFCVVRKKF